VNFEVPGATSQLAGFSTDFRVVTIGRGPEVDAVVDAALAVWPGLPVEETSTDHRRPRPHAAPNVHVRPVRRAHPGPDPQARPHREQVPPVDVDEFVSHRVYVLMPSLGWLAAFGVMGLVFLVVFVGGYTASLDDVSVAETVLFYCLALLAALVGLALLGLSLGLPRRWARQGVRVHPHGLTLVRDPAWLAGGLDIDIPWEEVTGFRADVETYRGRRRPRVFITLTHFDDTLPLPDWAAFFVHTGTGERTLVIDTKMYLGPGLSTYQLIPVLHRARPDLWR
jgi:hypothetical protein